MGFKVLTILSLLVLFVSCKKTPETSFPDVDKIDNQNSQEITEADVSKLKYIDYTLDVKTEDAIKDWKEYTQLQDIISNIKRGDLSFFNDNEEQVKILIKDLKDNMPKQVKSPSVSARLLVWETKILKLESLSNLSTTSKDELLDVIKEFLVACSNVNFQMNKKVEFDSRTIEKP